jgi:hypothetical protein
MSESIKRRTAESIKRPTLPRERLGVSDVRGFLGMNDVET